MRNIKCQINLLILKKASTKRLIIKAIIYQFFDFFYLIVYNK